MNNGKRFALRITALMLCLFTVSAGLSSCGYFTESYLASFTEGPSKTQERVEFTYPEIIDFTPETTAAPETTNKYETTSKPQTTQAPETTAAPELTDNIPDVVQNNVYLSRINQGRCKQLVGDVVITVIMLSDDVSSWSNAAQSELSAELSKQEKAIEKTAADYGKNLDITFSYLSAKVSGDAAAGEYSNTWVESALANAGLGSIEKAQKTLDAKNGADSNPVVFALNKAGRAYAQWYSSLNSTEFAVVFSTGLDSFTHELFHLYGAEDFYYPSLVKDLADNYLTDSIMNSGEKADPLTAFIIGWDDEMDAEALEFLKKTNHLTHEYLNDENEKQSVTGNVTAFQLSYGTYTGNLERGTPDGEGEIIYTDGDRYKGTFDGGIIHGQGIYTWADGGSYEGDWVYGERTGKGSYTWPNGDRFVGNWVNGNRTGEGTLTFADGTVYQGNWENDAWNGKGKMTWPDGTYYEGDYKDGDRHGKGTYHYANGNIYVGDWVKGERVGQGTFTFANGTVYVGSFVDGQFSGKGKMTWTDGSCYEGEFKDGDRHGQGTYTYASGHVYVGGWSNGNRNGYGKMTWADKSSYDGNWKDNKRHGYGKYINQYGQIFDGQWQNDVFQG